MRDDRDQRADAPHVNPWLALAAMLALLMCATAGLHLAAHPVGATTMLDPTPTMA